MRTKPPEVEHAKRERGRRWDRKADRCVTCRFWVGPLTDERDALWRKCEKHSTLTSDEGGCVLHLVSENKCSDAQRSLSILARRAQGASFRQIGAEFHISRQRAHQIFEKAMSN